MKQRIHRLLKWAERQTDEDRLHGNVWIAVFGLVLVAACGCCWLGWRG